MSPRKYKALKRIEKKLRKARKRLGKLREKCFDAEREVASLIDSRHRLDRYL